MRSSLDELEQYLPNLEARDPAVSQWSVREQIHHALLSADAIARAVADSTPGARSQSFSIVKSIVLLTGKIPRGRGQAPERALPSAEVSREELEQLLARARQSLTAAEASDSKAWFDHFVFGVMYRDSAIKLLHIHTRHHLAIIAAILE
jgi:hypothetical protein